MSELGNQWGSFLLRRLRSYILLFQEEFIQFPIYISSFRMKLLRFCTYHNISVIPHLYIYIFQVSTSTWECRIHFTTSAMNNFYIVKVYSVGFVHWFCLNPFHSAETFCWDLHHTIVCLNCHFWIWHEKMSTTWTLFENENKQVITYTILKLAIYLIHCISLHSSSITYITPLGLVIDWSISTLIGIRNKPKTSQGQRLLEAID